MPAFKRVLIKLSGEALQGSYQFGIDPSEVHRISLEIAEVHRNGIQIGLVIGGGNIFRGKEIVRQLGIEPATADTMGMLATVMNCLAMQAALEKIGVDTRVQTAIPMPPVAEPFIRRRAIRHMEKGRIVIFGAGTGNPFFSTDTAAALRAMEISADVLIKATKVDGIYDSDPELNPKAVKFDRLTYIDLLNRRLEVMDSTAITLCMENNLPILVLNLWDSKALHRALRGEHVGTLVSA